MSLALPRGETPIVWAIAGSDSSAGAGLQADLKTLTALGAHGCAIVTSITAQNSGEVCGSESVSPVLLRAQMDALQRDMPPKAIKIGMLGDAETVRVLVEKLKQVNAYTVYDPVIISTSGTTLLSEATVEAMRECLLPQVDLITPNCAEAEALTGMVLANDSDVERAAQKLLETNVKAVLIKGWNCGGGYVQDYYTDGRQSFWLTLPAYEGEVPRGTGCTMSSAIAAAHAFGFDEVVADAEARTILFPLREGRSTVTNADAVVIGKAYVSYHLPRASKLGKGPPFIHYKSWPVDAASFPWLTSTAEAGRNCRSFPDCGSEPLGFYPVVDSVAWLRRLLPFGVRTVQLRIKDADWETLETDIADAIAFAKQCGTRLFINDYWPLAIKHGAYGVHLGQEDLAIADLDRLAASGVRLGVSTHSYAELARALALGPSYIALGPIYPTTLKAMKFAPQGIDTLRIWRKLVTCPLVAIGGITLEKAAAVAEAGADSIAVVSDITRNSDPESRAKNWLRWFRS